MIQRDYRADRRCRQTIGVFEMFDTQFTMKNKTLALLDIYVNIPLVS